jgi:hypothetical protein
MPTTINLEIAIQHFLDLGRRLQGMQPLSGELVLEEVISWYRDTRITGADLNADGDMLLFQWGAEKPFKVSEPTDMRALRDGEVEFFTQELQYLDFMRQVFATGDEEGDEREEEFDDLAVQLSITLAYEDATGEEASSNLWIYRPEDVSAGVDKFRSIPFVQSLLFKPARLATFLVNPCG